MAQSELSLWGGVECSVTRIGDAYRDQLAETGHKHRLGDLDAIAQLGIKTLRYPVLWESVAPDQPDSSDWSWHDERLLRLRDLGVSMIAGLIHHGSGPRYSHLLDENFAEGLAKHAANVARRYPWLHMFAPVNEPLTTARFSCLYGHWYPHAKGYPSFLRALLNQCRATVLAIRAIRRITPEARLVQTEDLGKTFSTPALKYQADHENERRWLSLDLLCGRVDRSHPWYEILRVNGATDHELDFFLDGGGVPDIVGVNHYLTSERYLDTRLRNYPEEYWGGNDRHRYADVAAARAHLPIEEIGPAARLREAWQRYGLPLAITEAHNGSVAEEQVRWLGEVWSAAQKVRSEGAEIRAVTIWSIFGAVDWNSLLTRRDGFYESGVFDTRSDPPTPTLLAEATVAFGRTGVFKHSALSKLGWWRQADRYYGRQQDRTELKCTA